MDGIVGEIKVDSAPVAEAMAFGEGAKLAIRKKNSIVNFGIDSESLFSYLTTPKVTPN